LALIATTDESADWPSPKEAADSKHEKRKIEKRIILCAPEFRPQQNVRAGQRLYKPDYIRSDCIRLELDGGEISFAEKLCSAQEIM
jgi:hypothetical protein